MGSTNEIMVGRKSARACIIERLGASSTMFVVSDICCLSRGGVAGEGAWNSACGVGQFAEGHEVCLESIANNQPTAI